MSVKNLNMKALSLAITLVSMTFATQSFAQQTDAVTAENKQDIQQLRQEVQELRQLLQSYSQSNTTITTQVTSPVASVAVVNSPTKAVEPPNGILSLAKAEVKVYGNIRLDASYQAEGGSASRLYNQINTVPLKGDKERSDEFKSTLSATRIGLDFKSPVLDQTVSGKLEMDFLGGAGLDNLRIRHAYLNYNQWLIGQTWSNFAVPDYMPETIDALGYVGGSVKRTPQVRYSYTIQPGSQLVVAAEDPKDSTVQARLPALTARWNQKIGDDLNMSLRTMAHEKRIESNEEWSWGVGLGAKYDFTPQTSLKADYYHVKGDSSFVSWANSGVVKQGSEIVALSEFDSITVGVAQKINDKTRATLGYGYMKFKEDQTYIVASPQANKELWQAWVNVFYSPVKPISFGLEYVYGEREVFTALEDGTKKGEDNRVSMLAQYNF
ncbi:hypothetical protein FW754_15690 [Acinetobacter sp. 1207_04]|uniref:DcaP family trimeric outer membrane transporter n=1 Tax=Acinetobacter sp. 1207_04 TaxID=2604449 RepID=UPI00405A14A9